MPCDCPGARDGTDGGRAHYTRGARGPEPVLNLAGEGPCCDAPSWPECDACPHYPPVSRLLNAMEDARPAGAALPEELGNGEAIEALQMEAFAADLDEWWLVTSEAELEAALARAEAGEDA